MEGDGRSFLFFWAVGQLVCSFFCFGGCQGILNSGLLLRRCLHMVVVI